MKRLIALLLLTAPLVGLAQSPQDLYNQGLRLERSQGDLPGAIALYERVAGDFGGDRALGAEALLRIGQAYETLGESEAQRAYRRIVAEFADQSETAALAEEALGRLLTGASVPEKNLGLDPSLTSRYWLAAFSQDGRFFINSDWSSNSLAYQEVGKPGVTHITEQFEEPAPNSDLAYPGRFSPDNRYIAYVWWDGDEKTHWLHVYDRETEETRVLFNNEARVGITPGEAYAYVEVYDWTSDSRSILMTTFDDSGFSGFEMIDASSGELVKSVTIDLEGQWSDAKCLIDDRYVLFNRSIDGKDVGYRIDFESGETTRLVPGASTSALVACSDAADLALVRTDLFGDLETWVYELAAGLPSGEAAPIREVLPDASGLGLTSSGALHYYRAPSGGRKFEVLPFAQDTWTINGPGQLLQEGTGWRIGWARETGRMAYMASLFGYDLRLRETDGSEVSVDASRFYRVPPEGYVLMNLSADGSMLFARNFPDDGTTLRIDSETGSVIDTLTVDSAQAGLTGSTMLAGRRRDDATMCVDAYTGVPVTVEEVVCFEDDWSENISSRPSGDGSWLLVFSYAGDERRFLLVNRSTGDARVIFEDEGARTVMWAPGSTDLVFMAADLKYYRSDRNGENAQLIFPRLQEVRRILQGLVFHPTEPLVMIDSSPKATDESGSVLYTVRDLRSRFNK